MTHRTLVVFDTATIPEYYVDVHKIVAYPREWVVTYDYRAKNIDSEAQAILDELQKAKSPCHPVLLAYIQAPNYTKATGQPPAGSLPGDSLQVLTRLAHIVAVRTAKHDQATRYYFDLRLGGYPYDRNCTNAALVVKDLRKRGCIPMGIYVAQLHDTIGDTIFSQNVADDQGFASVVENLGANPSQFAGDTFWRVTAITQRSKSAVPLSSKIEQPVAIRTAAMQDKADVSIDCHDQTVLTFHLAFHRAREDLTAGYRPRRIQLESSPKSLGDSAPSEFPSRSFGLETVAVGIPSTSSLSQHIVEYRLETMPNPSDANTGFPPGPQLAFEVKYNKDALRVVLAFGALLISTALIAWATFVPVPAPPSAAQPCLIWQRVGASVLGVLTLLYAYYLWSDDISLDKLRG